MVHALMAPRRLCSEASLTVGDAMANGDTRQIQSWNRRLRAGDDSAMNELLSHFERRLVGLTRKMLGRYPSVHRWEHTDDVYQRAALRLNRALREVSPRDTREFFGLAALQIRRELLNLAESYRRWVGPSGLDQGEARDWSGGDGNGSLEPADHAEGPEALAEWSDFHEAAGALPEKEREVFDLLWYQGLTQEEAAGILGVSERTVRARWHGARLAIHRALDGRLPGSNGG